MPRKRKSGRPEEGPPAERPARRYPRISSRRSILVRRIGGPLQGRLATTESMGAGGCSFTHEEPQVEGQTLYLSILFGHELAQARVRVVYSREREAGGYEIGVEFVEVPQRDLELIRSLVAGTTETPR